MNSLSFKFRWYTAYLYRLISRLPDLQNHPATNGTPSTVSNHPLPMPTISTSISAKEWILSTSILYLSIQYTTNIITEEESTPQKKVLFIRTYSSGERTPTEVEANCYRQYRYYKIQLNETQNWRHYNQGLLSA